jgi:hypothetical protein
MLRQAGAKLLRPLPYLPASPLTGVDNRLRRGRDRQQYTTLPASSDPSLSSAVPSWARVVRDGASATSQPPLPQVTLSPREEFLRLSELCVANGFTVAQWATSKLRFPAGSEFHQQTLPLKSPDAGGGDVGIRPWVTWRTT